MTPRIPVVRSSMLVLSLVAAAADVSAQGRRSGAPPANAPAQGRRSGGPGPATASAPPVPSDPLAGPVVTSAPYSGNAMTTIVQTLGDGTRIEQRTEAKFYRDGAGRIRREQTILGLAALNPSAEPQTVVTIDPTPDDAFAFTLDPATRTARRVPRAGGPALSINLNGSPYFLSAAADALRGASGTFTFSGVLNEGRVYAARVGAPAGVKEESLGNRQIEGVTATGRRITSTIPTGQIGNDRPIEITDERWESPELKVLVYSRFSDPRTGVVEYKLMNIVRAEPPADLFVVPSDYTVVEPGIGARGGARTGGPGGRGGPQ